ncbi:hypothetical protein CMO92_01645 [Candidatus Woesearchaeota archaeon]|nr:hypothetical protein [Candidatus Woesearchaeota archaeon]|tara:strand:+ start:469 stop:948 length:480 start_codon:yes stop_codon:yes gene_type:complete
MKKKYLRPIMAGLIAGTLSITTMSATSLYLSLRNQEDTIRGILYTEHILPDHRQGPLYRINLLEELTLVQEEGRVIGNAKIGTYAVQGSLEELTELKERFEPGDLLELETHSSGWYLTNDKNKLFIIRTLTPQQVHLEKKREPYFNRRHQHSIRPPPQA